VLEIEGDESTVLSVAMNGKREECALGNLRDGTRAFFTNGWLTEAWCLHRALAGSEYAWSFDFESKRERDVDWYYLRVRQNNGQYGWTSPIWVE
jgi:hypothetical protein